MFTSKMRECERLAEEVKEWVEVFKKLSVGAIDNAIKFRDQLESKDSALCAARGALKEIKEMMPKPCEHFAFHGAMLECIEDALSTPSPCGHQKRWTDKMRLDWLTRRVRKDFWESMGMLVSANTIQVKLRTPRQAIDAAMKAERTKT